ncbi:MAG: anaerobic ribonucleoside-triphosphate reductase activating protein [Turicibacter sp.]|uniref:Anaerobic ribonucleoside-triphosphate reductase-activating protein n=1 Tax=Turicibacter faecis TaxID=2963365 RepID=A0ABM8IL55_9FIRM|nr:anaerobic ribonucleoside-triphosphate reductase activating protein [Turicibacter sp. 1E2]MCI8701822.1 anaerobic ribonucleoside-triphosphate reductase activating protein [Turicibacter sp.]MCU7209703.1 anaerobic ribonucleoside-triphosphate reductase activating protein [Turicibacter sp. 1E2]BEH91653.1 anaerobic ribonucleoside-triphosphate reductase-activating protein [Turicibacter sp. TC023]
MYYAQIRKFDTANGTGIRSTLFVSGCTHKCKGCFNQDYKHFRYGHPWTKEIEDKFIEHIKNPNVHGVTILGGEPMDQVRDTDLKDLVCRIKEETGQNIWIYSGYTFEEIMMHKKTKEILKYCDILVDGPFIEEQKDLRLRFKGSKNQRIIDVQKTLSEGKVTLLENY